MLTLGEAGVTGKDEKHFGRPTDIAWLPDGTFFISDGYVNTRVMKFDPSGKFLMQWGTPGTGNSQFNTVHAIDIDKDRKLYVSDRGNGRIQVFDENGKYLDQFGGMRQPQHIMITADGHLATIGGNNNKVVKYDLKGKMITSWGTQGTFPGAIWNPHQLSVDTAGNLYIAEATGGRTQKFRPRPGRGSIETDRAAAAADAAGDELKPPSRAAETRRRGVQWLFSASPRLRRLVSVEDAP